MELRTIRMGTRPPSVIMVFKINRKGRVRMRNRYPRSLSLVLLFLSFFFCTALQSEAAPSTVLRPPLIFIRLADESAKPVILQSLEVKADIVGGLAKTEVQMVFYNPNNRVLEGELHFPLLEGQNVESFALEMEDGALREAVAVGKAKGREAFDSVTRRRIDPALLEKTLGNNFKLRVYPLNPQKTRRVVLRYTDILPSEGDTGFYRLLFSGAEKLDSFSLAMKVEGASGLPVVKKSPLGRMDFKKSGERAYTAHIKGEKIDISRSDALILVSVPLAKREQVTTQPFKGETYFYAQIPSRMIGEAAKLSQPLSKIKTIGILWDGSGSGKARDRDTELRLIQSIVNEHKNVAIRFQVVRDQAEPVKKIAIRNGDWKELRKQITDVRYDGASNLKAFVPHDSVDAYLFFTDGLSNYGSEDGTMLNFSAFKAPIFTISSSPGADSDLLRAIADKTGGRFVDLTKQSDREGTKSLLSKRAVLSAVQTKGLKDVLVSSKRMEGEFFPISGILEGETGQLNLTFLLPDGSKKTVALPIVEKADASEIAAKEWARMKISALGSDYYGNKGRLEALGKKFTLVTRNTSLIVLDRVEDYVRYKIEPPAELKAAYDRMMADENRTPLRMTKEEHGRRLSEMWKQYQDWWRADYPKGKAPATPHVPRPLQDFALGTMPVETRALAPSSPGPEALEKPMPSEKRKVEAVPTEEATEEKAPAAYDLKKIRGASNADAYRIYLSEREKAEDNPYFYMDAADIFKAKKMDKLADRILSNLAEISLEDRRLLRLLGDQLMAYGRYQEAVMIYSKVMRMAEEEPQSYRDLALAYAAMGNSRQGVAHLWNVVSKQWDPRFPQIQLTTLVEMNQMIQRGGVNAAALGIPKAYVGNMPLDLRVVATWDTDNTDVNLVVVDPNEEIIIYGARPTYQGGLASGNFFRGYGPEVFSLKKAKPGMYKIKLYYGGNRSQSPVEFTTVKVVVYRHYGTAKQSEQVFRLRLGAQAGYRLTDVAELKIR